MISQTERLWSLLRDARPHRTDEILSVVYGSEHAGIARIGARIADVKKKHNVNIKGHKDKQNPSLYWYQADVPEVLRVDGRVVLPPAFPEKAAPKKATNTTDSLFL